jgi:Zn-dependent peptidase ImmA (M78 family)
VMSSYSRADIWVRAESPVVRQRFTLAHELGHLLLHPVGEEFRDAAPGMSSHPPTEIQANAFACALLMPRAMLEPLLYESSYSIDEMAQMFDVAPQALGLRVEWLLKGKRDL